MNAVLTAARSEIRRRKLQTLVIAFVILLSSGAATLALNLLVESDAPYAHAFSQAQGAHVIVTYAADKVTPARLRDTASAHGVTAAAGPWPQVIAMYATSPDGQGNMEAGRLFIVGRPGPDTSVDRLTMESGRWAHGPGEVVIARQLADSWGVHVGDRLSPDGGSHGPLLRIVGVAASISPSCVNVLVTFATGDKGFASAGSHDLDPPGALVLSFALKVFQCSDMMDGNPIMRPA